MNRVDPWEELLKAAGTTTEDIGKLLKYSKELSADKLEELSNNLRSVADSLDTRVKSLREKG